MVVGGGRRMSEVFYHGGVTRGGLANSGLGTQSLRCLLLFCSGAEVCYVFISDDLNDVCSILSW